MKYLIAGGWAAGTAAALHLRKLDSSSEITIVDAESVAYYPRPDLIEYLAGRKSKDQLIVHGASWYGENRITLISGRRIMHVHAIEHEVTLDDGTVLSYDRLLLANGASPFVPPLPGADQAGVFTLRTLDDADALLARIVPGATVVVVGGGLLGLEAARALAERGMKATIIEFAGRLLPNQLDERSAEMLVEHLQASGITALLGAESQQIVSGEHGATGVLLKDGRLAQGEFILFSTGVRPNVTIAQEAGIAIGRGIQVNDSMQTSAPDVYAAGDVVEHRGRVYGIVPPCLEQARVAAQNMVSPGTATYEGSIMSSSLKTCGIDVLSMGNINPTQEQHVQVIQAQGQQAYRKVVLENGIIVGVILYGTMNGARQLQQALRSHTDLMAFQDRLADLDWDFAGM
ncbi:NAD(P)/FAD-dependent oxidoreductase [Candidatus Cryosericum odellii]|jgi:nitrite reductase (NADH) large subunit|uniref:NAD(P)/FAD-dependent oxidoreductase n=1 Tax=Candidatus Cryosericum odellii TaxID=2290917 RepID=A0A398D8E9_9BACT|nr:FAD-dependent oxidoreductase [Candidatus Cryosericum odellii]RIE08678.1 NAD(P)/FAD-dependent oxidoreductase [Candidatus Cryosericum odellii]RIE14904.1 NAD(P)/FAD-dependent oxidoreductase [Candidatus Cryosericum odellii]